MEFSKELLERAAACEELLRDRFAAIDAAALENTARVLDVFRANMLSERHFAPSAGYGYNDDGRELCDRAFAQIFGCEAGFANIISGTHALAIGLYGLLRPGDTLLSATGKPYDTLDEVIGLSGNPGDGSLKDLGVAFRSVELVDGKTIDYAAVEQALQAGGVRIVFCQRSKGYQNRRTLTVAEIDRLYELVRRFEGVYLYVDNCYGEFCETREPKADLLAGSLIKNAGGGIAETGGYLVGSERAVELAAYRLSVPGMGAEAGATLGTTKPMLKGLFFAPHVVAQALKTAHFAAALFERSGYDCFPAALEPRSDIIQTLLLGSREKLLRFCKGIQSGSPVDSFVTPEGWAMPGYSDEVVMAAGAFTQGSSIELSADAPIKPPYRVYMQGGLTYESGKLGVLAALQAMEAED